MRRRSCHCALVLLVFYATAAAAARQSGHPSHHQPASGDPDGLRATATVSEPPHAEDSSAREQAEAAPLGRGGFPLLVRPSTLAATIEELAGHPVRVVYARVVGVFNPRAFLVDTSTSLPPVPGNRARLLVLVAQGSLVLPATTLVSSTVTIRGTARTLLGLQASREVPWPHQLGPESVQRLEVRGGVLATSVRTAEGIELTGRGESPTPNSQPPTPNY